MHAPSHTTSLHGNEPQDIPRPSCAVIRTRLVYGRDREPKVVWPSQWIPRLFRLSLPFQHLQKFVLILLPRAAVFEHLANYPGLPARLVCAVP